MWTESVPYLMAVAFGLPAPALPLRTRNILAHCREPQREVLPARLRASWRRTAKRRARLGARRQVKRWDGSSRKPSRVQGEEVRSNALNAGQQSPFRLESPVTIAGPTPYRSVGVSEDSREVRWR